MVSESENYSLYSIADLMSRYSIVQELMDRLYMTDKNTRHDFWKTEVVICSSITAPTKLPTAYQMHVYSNIDFI